MIGRKPPRAGVKALRWPVSVLALLATSCGVQEKEAPLPPRPPVVNITMREYSLRYDHAIPRGRVVLRATNAGHRRHELVLERLPEDFPPIDVQLHSKTKRAVATVAYLHVLRPGTHDAIAVDLAPGRYAMLSFTKSHGGTPDALKGMNSEFRVR